MIYEKSQIRELYDIKHINDSDINSGYDYENKFFMNLFSNMMFGNNITSEFMMNLQKNTIWMIESVLPIRNFWNYTVDKYYNKHNN